MPLLDAPLPPLFCAGFSPFCSACLALHHQKRRNSQPEGKRAVINETPKRTLRILTEEQVRICSNTDIAVKQMVHPRAAGAIAVRCLWERHGLPRFEHKLVDTLKFQITSRREFERLKACDPATLTDLERAARFLYLQKTCLWRQGQRTALRR